MHVNAHLYVPDADCRAPPRRPSHPPVESHEERSHPSNHTTASQPSYPYHRHDSIPAKPTLWTLAILQFKHSTILQFKHSTVLCIVPQISVLKYPLLRFNLWGPRSTRGRNALLRLHGTRRRKCNATTFPGHGTVEVIDDTAMLQHPGFVGMRRVVFRGGPDKRLPSPFRADA